jgi:DNA polymerase III epsilon subunit-like protein
MKILFFDTETTGIPPRGAHWEADFERFQRIAAIAWRMTEDGETAGEHSFLIRPSGWKMPKDAEAINGLSNEKLAAYGYKLKPVLQLFLSDATRAERIVGHNVHFDISMVKSELLRLAAKPDMFISILAKEKRYCTMHEATGLISDKWPKLGEIYRHFFNEELENAHDPLTDLIACQRVYNELIRLNK